MKDVNVLARMIDEGRVGEAAGLIARINDGPATAALVTLEVGEKVSLDQRRQLAVALRPLADLEGPDEE